MSMEMPVRLVITGNVLEMQPCGLYAHTSAVLHSHHVIPESWWIAAGRPVGSPLVEICPTCHYNTHAAIDGTLRHLDISHLPLRCVKLAADGIAGALAAGLTPALTL
jgi:hypothetical protein